MSNQGKAILLFLLAVALGANMLAGFPGSSEGAPPPAPRSFPEAEELRGKDLTFRELTIFFETLAKEKGARYAFDVLRVAPLPGNTDLHLLGHEVGDELYKQEGVEGIKTCTQEFRNACSHSIVVGLFMDQGEGALDDIAEACRKAPGGSGAYTMCFHGLGHGILAYTGYDMPKAIELCKKTGTAGRNNREYVECVGGTIMEIVGGGFHNMALWKKQSALYLSKEKPLGICLADFMPKEARGQCITYITPYLFIAAGGNLQKPTEENFADAFPFCEAIPASDPGNLHACYGGFGKEFVVLAQDRDIRRIDQMSDAQLSQIHAWCALAEKESGIQACMESAVNSIYWGGENDRAASIRFCALAPTQQLKDACHKNLMGAVFYFVKDKKYLRDFCGEIPSAYREECTGRIKV